MARHRHAINVRADGLTAVLGPLGDDPAVRAALLVDIDSGMVLAATGHPSESDREALGAVHGELMRLACDASVGLAGIDPAGLDTEITVDRGPRCHLVARRIGDPYGDRLALSVLVDGPARALRRVRRRLGEVSVAALTAGPTVSLRPRDGVWVPGAVEERPVLPTPSRGPAPAPTAAPGPVTAPPPNGPAVTMQGGARRTASSGIVAAEALWALSGQTTAPLRAVVALPVSAPAAATPATAQPAALPAAQSVAQSVAQSATALQPADPAPAVPAPAAAPDGSAPEPERRPAPPSALPSRGPSTP